MASFIVLVAYLIAVCVIYLCYQIYHQYTYWKKRKVLDTDLIPIMGSMGPLLLGRPLAIHTQNLYDKFPGARYYGGFDMGKPMVLIRDPELYRDISIKNFDYFTDHSAFVSEEMDPIVGRNVFSLKGQHWREVRSMLSPNFTATRMKIMFDLIAECSKDLIEYFVAHPEVILCYNENLSLKKYSCHFTKKIIHFSYFFIYKYTIISILQVAKSFDGKDIFTRYTVNVIATAAFGVKVNSLADKENDFYIHGVSSMQFRLLTFAKVTLMRFFPKIMRLFGATFLRKSDDLFFKNLIRETVRSRKENGIIRPDMIHLLMQAMDKKDGIEVTIDDIIAQAFLFFLAGFDTISSLIGFVAHELAANSDVQEKLHQEVEEWFEKNDGDITYESLIEMKYLDMVISEALRKYPPAPINNRLCVKEYELPPATNGYSKCIIEKDTVIYIPIFAIHRDSKYFPEPDKFIPERFSGETNEKTNPAFIPFGQGPRKCIANRFALMEAKILIFNIVRKFVIKFTDKTKHPITFAKTNFTLSPKDGFWLQFEERKKIN